MTATVRRLRDPRPAPYTVLQLRQRWALVNGTWHREAVARRADGALRLVLVRDDVRAAA